MYTYFYSGCCSGGGDSFSLSAVFDCGSIFCGGELFTVVFVLEVQNLMVVVVVLEQILQNKYYPIHVHFEPHHNVIRVIRHYPPPIQYLNYI